MRQHVALLASAFVLGGCSLIYNPSNIGNGEQIDAPKTIDARIDAKPDAKPDAEIILDTNPAALSITGVTPATIDEGQGDDNGRPVVLVLVGEQITGSASVTIAAHDGTTVVKLTQDPIQIAADGRMLALPVHALVDGSLAEGSSVPLDISVTQPGVATPVVLESAVTLVGHDELDGSDGSASMALGSNAVFSSVTWAGSVTASTASAPLVIRSFSTLAITGTIDVSSGGQAGGPGGFAGGGTSTAGGGAGGGKSPGGGGAFAVNNTATNGGSACGDEALKSSSAPDRGNGGGGGSTGVGGGGGGSLQLVAGTRLQIGTIRSNGGPGGKGALLNTAGGGGSGGSVLLRAMTLIGAGGMVTVDGGAGGAANAGTAGQAGGPGRVRIDSPNTESVTVTSANASLYSAPVFVATGSGAPPVITMDPEPSFNFVGKLDTNFNVYFLDPQSNVHNVNGQTLGPAGTASVQLTSPLGRGTNHVCAAVEGASSTDSADPASATCIDVVYLFTP